MGNGAVRTMVWRSAAQWDRRASEEWYYGGYRGLDILTTQPVLSDLEFLHALAGLTHLSVRSPVARDEAAFDLPDLESLTLVTGSQRPVPSGRRQPWVTRLELSWRAGLDIGRQWPGVQSLTIGRVPSESLGFLGEAPELVELRLQGRRQFVDLAALATAPSLRVLRLLHAPVRGVAPLAGLDGLEELRLMCQAPTPHQGPIDCTHLTERLTWFWAANVSDFVNAEALLSLPRLRDVRLMHCALDEGDHHVLMQLGTRLHVVH